MASGRGAFLVALLGLCIVSDSIRESAAAAPSADLQGFPDTYGWWLGHEMKRREMPSMRLRFGKRDMRGMWTVSQRSMPSLRLRFGKRADDEVSWGDEDREVYRRSGGKTPAMRLRFGKRESDLLPEQDSDNSQEEE